MSAGTYMTPGNLLDDPEAAEAMRLLVRKGYTLNGILRAYRGLTRARRAEAAIRSHIEGWADTGGGE